MKKILSLFILAGFLLACNSNTNKETSNLEKKEAKVITDWIGVFQGTCPSYNMKNKNGGDLIINGNTITLPEIEYTYNIQDNNTCTIDLNADGKSYSCYNVEYTVVENNNGFTLTMYPQSGSDCGGHPMILVKDGGLLSVSIKGQPTFNVSKVK